MPLALTGRTKDAVVSMPRDADWWAGVRRFLLTLADDPARVERHIGVLEDRMDARLRWKDVLGGATLPNGRPMPPSRRYAEMLDTEDSRSRRDCGRAMARRSGNSSRASSKRPTRRSPMPTSVRAAGSSRRHSARTRSSTPRQRASVRERVPPIRTSTVVTRRRVDAAAPNHDRSPYEAPSYPRSRSHPPGADPLPRRDGLGLDLCSDGDGSPGPGGGARYAAGA